MSQTITVPAKQFDALNDKYCADKIAEYQSCPFVTLNGKNYVVTGGVFQGDNRALYLHQIVSSQDYNGDLKPLDYASHWLEVSKGNRERCYIGMEIETRGRIAVIVDKITVESGKAEKQAEPKSRIESPDQEQLSLFT